MDFFTYYATLKSSNYTSGDAILGLCYTALRQGTLEQRLAPFLAHKEIMDKLEAERELLDGNLKSKFESVFPPEEPFMAIFNDGEPEPYWRVLQEIYARTPRAIAIVRIDLYQMPQTSPIPQPVYSIGGGARTLDEFRPRAIPEKIVKRGKGQVIHDHEFTEEEKAMFLAKQESEKNKK